MIASDSVYQTHHQHYPRTPSRINDGGLSGYLRYSKVEEDIR